MTTSLPDVNVLLALVAAGHPHHRGALKWFESWEIDSVGICRVTQVGLLRLLTNPKVLSSGACSIARAWEISNEILTDQRAFFEHEPSGLEAMWAAMMSQRSVGASSWTDAYLAAFARQCDYELVTFDRGFHRWPGLSAKVPIQA